MNLNTLAIGALVIATASGGAVTSCKSYSAPPVSFPIFEFVEGTGGVVLSCSSDGGDALCCPSTSAGVLVANGIDVGVLRIISDNGANVAPDKYQIVVASTDGKVTFGQPLLVGDAGTLQASSTVTIPVSLSGQQNDILVHAGTESGDAHIAVTIGSESRILCLPLSASEPVGLSVQVTPVNGAPTNWVAYQLSVNLGAADGGQVSDSVLLRWSATGCALLSAATTDVPGRGSAQNTIYLPPGWTQSEVTVTAENGSVMKTICLTPQGGASPAPPDGGSCPRVEGPDAGDASAGLKVICPPLLE
jgi:hypothetical protein